MSVARNDLLDFHRETLVDGLVQLLLESIFSGKYPPKSMISEASVAKEFGVGRVPDRETLLICLWQGKFVGRCHMPYYFSRIRRRDIKERSPGSPGQKTFPAPAPFSAEGHSEYPENPGSAAGHLLLKVG